MKRVTVVSLIAGGCVLSLALAFSLPRLTDHTSPRLFVRGVQENGSYRENPQLELEMEDLQGELSLCMVILDGETVYVQPLAAGSFVHRLPLVLEGRPEGAHRLEVVVADNAWPPNRGRKVFTLHYDITPPRLTWHQAGESLAQGDVLMVDIAVEGERALTLQGVFRKVELVFYTLRNRPGVYRTLIPASGIEQTGIWPLELNASDAAGNQAAAGFPVTVVSRKFPSEAINLNSEKSKLLIDADASRRNRERLAAVLSDSVGERLWQGKFIRPAAGIVSSEFGTRRVYNNGVTYSYHKGLDLANVQGTPVYAANTGRVVLAEELPLNGNSVVIDHGLGVFSLYYHMHQLVIQSGTMVARGEQLGVIGTTGISTGPHLHWEMQVHHVAVRAQQWEEREF